MKGFLGPIIKTIGQAIAKEAGKASKRSLPDIISTSVTVIFTLIGMVACVITAYMYLASNILDRHAMLVVTLGVFILAIISAFIARNIMSKDDAAVVEDHPTTTTHSKNEEMIAALGLEAGKLIGKHPKNAALIAMAVGVSLGVSPELRNALIDQVFSKK